MRNRKTGNPRGRPRELPDSALPVVVPDGGTAPVAREVMTAAQVRAIATQESVNAIEFAASVVNGEVDARPRERIEAAKLIVSTGVGSQVHYLIDNEASLRAMVYAVRPFLHSGSSDTRTLDYSSGEGFVVVLKALQDAVKGTVASE